MNFTPMNYPGPVTQGRPVIVRSTGTSKQKDKQQTSKQQPASKRWCFTLNNPQIDEIIPEELCEYGIIGNEIAPETQTKHLQGFVSFKVPKRLNQVKAILPRAHWEKAKGSVQQNFDYCSKDGNFKEFGERPIEPCESATKKRKADYDLAVELAKKQRIYEIDSDMLLRFGSSLRAIQREHPLALPDNDYLCGYWFYGAPGTGKSRSARWLFGPGAYPKPLNKWWDGYQNEPYVILDDFEPVHAVLGHHLKQWADHYPFTAEQKGTSIRIRPAILCVTSNYRINEIWMDDMRMQEAIRRRFQQINFDQ